MFARGGLCGATLCLREAVCVELPCVCERRSVWSYPVFARGGLCGATLCLREAVCVELPCVCERRSVWSYPVFIVVLDALDPATHNTPRRVEFHGARRRTDEQIYT